MPLPPSPSSRDGRTLLEGLPTRYRLQRLLGAGGFGAVYLATDSVLQRDVAIKVLTGHASEHSDALRKEARALAAVPHPNIVNVLDVLELPHADVLILEYVAGGTIGSILETGLVPPRDQALRWIGGIAAALAAVHQAGLLHCDLKPDNVLVDATGHARLTDFGVARYATDGDVTASGSLGYAAPEVMLGEAPSAASDVYSLGVVSWELLTGRRAFEAARTIDVLRSQTTAALPPIAVVAPDLPAEIRDMLARCLEAEPNDRPASAHEVCDALVPVVSNAYPTRELEGLGITVIVPALILTLLLGTLLFTWIDRSDVAAVGEMSFRRFYRYKFRWLIEGALLLAATMGLFVSSMIATVRRLMATRSPDAPASIGTVLHKSFAPPRWWPTWYPGQSERHDLQRLPDQIRYFRLLLWWGLPVVFTALSFLLVLGLGRPPLVSLQVARLALGTALLYVCLLIGLLINIVVTYRESPLYDAFELAAVAVVRSVNGDIARALPMAAAERRQAEFSSPTRPWYKRLISPDDLENARVAQSPAAQYARVFIYGALALGAIAWLGRIVIRDADKIRPFLASLFN